LDSRAYSKFIGAAYGDIRVSFKGDAKLAGREFLFVSTLIETILANQGHAS
jgi:hypothetical protein